MSTSLLYQAFGVVGYRYVNQSFREGRVSFRIEQPRERLRCRDCGKANVWCRGGVERRFRTVPIGGKPVEIVFKVPRVLCFACEHDHPGCRRPFAGQLGYHQGDSD